MLRRIASSWLEDSERLLAALERALSVEDARELAHAAHAWRSCNGHVGAVGLMALCRELEACGRDGDLSAAPGLLQKVRALYARVSDELQGEVRKLA
jgi:HPt (histidine-containing phosphotransfer) domain-containing protein